MFTPLIFVVNNNFYNTMAVTKSTANNISSPEGNSLAVFLDASDSTLKVKDVNGVVDTFESLTPIGSATFKNIAVDGEDTIVAETSNDTLTFGAGNLITLSTNASTKNLAIDCELDSILLGFDDGDSTGNPYGIGLYYRDSESPYAPAGLPDFASSSDLGGIVVNGTISSYANDGDSSSFGSPVGLADMAFFDQATFQYSYGSGIIGANPATLLFGAFDYDGFGGLVYDSNTGECSANAFINTSDKDAKKNIEDVKSGLDVVMQLQGVEFDYKNGGGHSSGFIAQDVRLAVPHAITETESGLKMNYNSIMAYQNEAIKELKGMIDELKAEIKNLKNG